MRFIHFTLNVQQNYLVNKLWVLHFCNACFQNVNARELLEMRGKYVSWLLLIHKQSNNCFRVLQTFC